MTPKIPAIKNCIGKNLIRYYNKLIFDIIWIFESIFVYCQLDP